MIPSSRGMAVFALVLATAAHGLALQDFSAPEQTMIEGGGQSKAAALGASFQDFVAGTTTPAPATEQPAAPAEKPDAASRPTVTAAQPAPPALLSKPPADGLVPTASRPMAVAAVRPDPARTLRPEPDQQKKPVARPSRQGNADKSVRKGSATGTARAGAATDVAKPKAATAQGNAAASNYAGKIKRKIARARRKTVNIRGTAVVGFQIGDGGTLLSVSIVRSSGSKKLDQVALAQVRGAAPFPPPPPGARRSWTMEIVGK